MTFTNSEARRPCGPDCTKWNQNVDQASAGTALNGAPIRNENYSKWNSDKGKKLYESLIRLRACRRPRIFSPAIYAPPAKL